MIAMEPSVPINGELGLLAAAVFVTILIFLLLGRIGLVILEYLSYSASLTVLVFLRTGFGTRVLNIKDIIGALLFLYLVGNMVGHNYHDMYRDVGATVWGAQVHFTYLVVFIALAVYRKVEALQHLQSRKPSDWGTPGMLTKIPPISLLFARGGDLYRSVFVEPIVVVATGVFLALPLNNWFGWYLILTALLLFFQLLKGYLAKWQAMLDRLDNPVETQPEGGRQHEGIRTV